MNMFRQGDLLFVPATIPVGATEIKDGILARGEATGHTHRLRLTGAAIALAVMGTVYIKAKQKAQIDHEEHKTVELPIGDWVVQRQREYIPEGWKQVTD